MFITVIAIVIAIIIYIPELESIIEHINHRKEVEVLGEQLDKAEEAGKKAEKMIDALEDMNIDIETGTEEKTDIQNTELDDVSESVNNISEILKQLNE